MKTLLIPTEDHDTMHAVLETARLFAKRFDSYMEGFAVRPSAAKFVAMDPVSSLTVPMTKESDAEAVSQARRLFETFLQAQGVPRAQGEKSTYSFAWLDTAPDGDEFVGSYGRVFDLIVLGRPGPEPQHPRTPPLESALFESGRPVLIVPASPVRPVGDNVLIAWNGSTEQARTIACALPILMGAKQVTVLTVEGAMTPGPSGEQAARQLRLNGIPAVARSIAAGAGGAGEALLAEAKSLGCDLLVKGAYTQSRLRQMIFGGTTRHILANATLPVLMAH